MFVVVLGRDEEMGFYLHNLVQGILLFIDTSYQYIRCLLGQRGCKTTVKGRCNVTEEEHGFKLY